MVEKDWPHPHPKTAVAIEVEQIMDDRARVFEERWEKRTRTVNHRLLFLFCVMFGAIIFFAYRGEMTDDRIRQDAYKACEQRSAQFAAYNQAVPSSIAVIIKTANPLLTPAEQTRLVTSLTLQLQVPPLLCTEPS